MYMECKIVQNASTLKGKKILTDWLKKNGQKVGLISKLPSACEFGTSDLAHIFAESYWRWQSYCFQG